jgi:hypothetical protein
MNSVLGILILIIYFTNFHICNLVFPNDAVNWWYLNLSILSFLIILAVKYKEKGSFVEKLFNSMVANNILMLLTKHEQSYSINDIYFIAIFTLAQYLKTHTHEQK